MTGQRPIAIVTGGASRIGRALCESLVAVGHDIIFTYHTAEDQADQLAHELQLAGARAEAHRLDLADLDAVVEWSHALPRVLSRLDVLVHNAALYGPTPVDTLTPETVRTFHDINAAAPLVMTAALADLLRESSGCVVAMTDIHAIGLPRSGYAAYAMSKAALAEMVRSLARELAPDVRVNGIAPGIVTSPIAGAELDDRAREAYLKRVPLGRIGTEDDVVRTALWLITDAPYVTGQIIRIDGGRSLL
ncbi:MAG: SDR family oxidoreductase [Phycisphaerales bacterium]|nr:SDR family oxidoreductase [Phycisphaerales bacterium]